MFIYHYTYAYLCKNALYLCPSFSSFLPPTHTPHITSHSCAVLITGDLLSGGETGKNMAITVCTPKPKEMTEIEEAQESINCEFQMCLYYSWIFLIKSDFSSWMLENQWRVYGLKCSKRSVPHTFPPTFLVCKVYTDFTFNSI